MNCSYPDCGDGRCVGKKFCGKHLKTPFCTKAEVDAYRRGLRDGREAGRERVDPSAPRGWFLIGDAWQWVEK
jgi:hypothetical protein